MNWRDSEFKDLEKIVVEGKASSDVRSMWSDTDDSRSLLKENARTLVDGDDVLAIVGVAELWDGVGTVWTLLSDESRKHGVLLTKGVRRYIKMLHEERGYWRLQATVKRFDEPARLWIIRLGFSYEGTMVAYGPDATTHDMYASLVEN